MQAVRIVLGINRHRGQAHVGRRAGDADGDLAAIGDQQFRHAHDTCFRSGRVGCQWPGLAVIPIWIWSLRIGTAAWRSGGRARPSGGQGVRACRVAKYSRCQPRWRNSGLAGKSMPHTVSRRTHVSWLALGPPSTTALLRARKDVGGRSKAGHDTRRDRRMTRDEPSVEPFAFERAIAPFQRGLQSALPHLLAELAGTGTQPR